MVSQITDSVTQVLVRCQLNASRLVIGVSGGPDSVALLLALTELRQRYDLELHVAHFDHALRSDSAADADWVATLAGDLGTDLTIERAQDQDANRDNERVSEAASRQARYHFFRTVLNRVDARAVLVGHTQNDQLETRLLHVVRGTGLPGLRGMVSDSLVSIGTDPPVRVVRPLLDVSREQTEAYCANRGVVPRRDSTNGNLEYSRNRIRLSVVPELTTLNPRLAGALDRLGRIAGDSEAFIESELDRRLDGLIVISDGIWTIDRSQWRLLHPALKRALLRRVANELSPSREMGAESIESAIVAADQWTAGRSLQWTDDRVLIVEHDRVQISRLVAAPVAIRPILLHSNEPMTLDLTEVTSWDWAILIDGTWNRSRRPILRACPRSSVCLGRRQDRWHADLDGDKLGANTAVILRSRQPGDGLFPEGMSGRKKLQDLFVDAHVPERFRDQIPIVASSLGIAWVVGMRRDRRFAAGPGSTNVLCLDVIGKSTGDEDLCTDLATT